MIVAQGPSYYDRFAPNPDALAWLRLLAVPGRPFQSAEFNEGQTVLNYKIQLLASYFLQDGTFITGGVNNLSFSPNSSGVLVTVPMGRMWALGDFHNVPAGTVQITGVGSEVVGVQITPQYIVAEGVASGNTIVDPNLKDPAAGSEDLGTPGCDRLSATYQYVTGTAAVGSVPVAYFTDGQYIQNNAGQAFLNNVLAVVAQRAEDQFGSFIAVQPRVTPQPATSAASSNDSQIGLKIEGGIGFPNGVEVKNDSTTMSIGRPLTTNSVSNETQTNQSFAGTWPAGVIPLNNSPIRNVSQLSADVRNQAVAMTRAYPGLYGPLYQDSLVAPYNNVVSINRVYTGPSGSPTVLYNSGTNPDYQVSGGNIIWLSGGSMGSPASSYSVDVTYEANVVKGIRTQTSVSGVNPSGSGSTMTLPNTEIVDGTILLVNGATTYNNGTDYTFNEQTGTITWNITPPSASSVTASYLYWAHSTEGDYLARDSFYDTTGSNILYYATPNYAGPGPTSGYPSTAGSTMDYTEAIFLTGTGTYSTGGNSLVNSTQLQLNYTYTIGRVDTLVWNTNGTFAVNPGIPLSTRPLAPPTPADELAICDLHLPAEAFYTDVTVEFYDNTSMTVADMRSVFNQVQTLQYNMAQQQLAQNANSISYSQGPTSNSGYFTDNMADMTVMDTASPLFGGSWDMLGRTFSLPRYRYAANGETSGAYASGPAPVFVGSGCTLMEDIWVPNFTEETILSQTYRSSVQAINSFTGVNFNSSISLSPSVVSGISQNVTVTNIIKGTIAQNTPTFSSATLGNPVTPIAYGGVPLSATQLINNALTGSITNLTAAAKSVGQAVAKAKKGATVPINLPVQVQPQWLNAIQQDPNSTTVTQNQLSTVLSNVQVVQGSIAPQATITITGQQFRPNEGMIACYFDNILVPLTPAASNTAADTSIATFGSGCVKITDGSGTFTATFVIPPNQATGSHTITIIGHTTINGVSTVTSFAEAALATGSYVEEIQDTISIAASLPTGSQFALPAYIMCNLLGFYPNIAVRTSCSNSIALTIAEIAIQAANTNGTGFNGTTTNGSAVITTSNTAGLVVGQVVTGAGIPTGSTILSIVTNTSITISNNCTAHHVNEYIVPSLALNQTIFTTALSGLFDNSKFAPTPPIQALNAIWNAIAPTGNIVLTDATALSNAIYAINLTTTPFSPSSPWLGTSLQSSLYNVAKGLNDPLAETFQIPANRNISSVNLRVNVQNVSTASPVGVALVNVSNGFPTGAHLTEVWLTPTEINAQMVANKFVNFPFPKPIYLQANTDYAFVVMCSDLTTSVDVAQLGAVDENTGALITANPAAGAMLSSPNQDTWELISGQAMWFQLNACEFTSNSCSLTLQTPLPLGSITVSSTVYKYPIFNFNTPFSLPSSDCNIQWQYTIDNVNWTSFEPTVDVDLAQVTNPLLGIRLLINGNDSLAPVVVNAPVLDTYMYVTNGCYVPLEFTVPAILNVGYTGEVEYVDLFYQVSTTSAPPSTLTQAIPYISFPLDDFNGYLPMQEVTADRTNLGTGFTRVHYQYNTGMTATNTVTIGSANTVSLVFTGSFISGTFTGTTTSGSAVITTTNTAGLTVGQTVTGAGIPTSSTISSIVANTSVTLNNTATANHTNETLTVTPITITYNFVTGNTTANIVTGLISLINASPALNAAGVFATVNPAAPSILIVGWPNQTPGNTATNIVTSSSTGVSIGSTPATGINALKNHVQAKIVLQNTQPIPGSTVCLKSPQIAEVSITTRPV